MPAAPVVLRSSHGFPAMTAGSQPVSQATLVLSSEIKLVNSAYLENVMPEQPGLIAINGRASARSLRTRLSPPPAPYKGEYCPA
jgi:hypothetical protein